MIGDIIHLPDPLTCESATTVLLSLHFNAPHWPWEAPGDQAESERLRSRSIAAYDADTQKTYQKMIETMDAQIGRVLQALNANRRTGNIIVVFTSDNGGERFADTWPFIGRKTELLEGGLRIPSIVSWPTRIPQGRTSEQVSITMDWMPTLLGGERGLSRSPCRTTGLHPKREGDHVRSCAVVGNLIGTEQKR